MGRSPFFMLVDQTNSFCRLLSSLITSSYLREYGMVPLDLLLTLWVLQLFTYTLLILSCCIAFSAFLFNIIYLILTNRPVAPSESAIQFYFQFSRSHFESTCSNDIELYGKRLDTDSSNCGSKGRQFLLVELTDWCKIDYL